MSEQWYLKKESNSLWLHGVFVLCRFSVDKNSVFLFLSYTAVPFSNMQILLQYRLTGIRRKLVLKQVLWQNNENL